MQPHEQAEFLRAVSLFIKEQVEAAKAPLLEEIAEFKRQIGVLVDADKKWKDYYDHANDELQVIATENTNLINKLVSEKAKIDSTALEEKVQKNLDYAQGLIKTCASSIVEMNDKLDKLPVPKDGKDGAPGKDADMSEVDLRINGLREIHKDLDLKIASCIKQLSEKPIVDKDWMRSCVEKYVHTCVRAMAPALTGPAGPPGKDGVPGQDAAEVDYHVIRNFILENIPPAIPGAPGKDADEEKIKAKTIEHINSTCQIIRIELLNELKANLEKIPPPRDGKDADMEEIYDRLTKLVYDAKAQIMDEIPEVRDGKDGNDGTSVTIDDVRPVVLAAVDEAVRAIPKPVVPTGTVLDRSGVLSLVFSDGSTHKVGEVCGRDGTSVTDEQVRRVAEEIIAKIPRPRDGIDGVGFEAVACEFAPDTRTLSITFGNAAGDKAKVFELKLDTPFFKDYWKEGETYRRGDLVVLSGSLWHCNAEETTLRPETGIDAWSIAAKRGRDGKQGPPGPQGEKGKDGRDGRDLTQMTFEGQKY